MERERERIKTRTEKTRELTTTINTSSLFSYIPHHDHHHFTSAIFPPLTRERTSSSQSSSSFLREHEWILTHFYIDTYSHLLCQSYKPTPHYYKAISLSFFLGIEMRRKKVNDCWLPRKKSLPTSSPTRLLSLPSKLSSTPSLILLLFSCQVLQFN